MPKGQYPGRIVSQYLGHDSIESVKPVKNSEINKTIDFIHTNFGISFKMKDGSVKNIRTFKSELISAYINKQLKVNE